MANMNAQLREKLYSRLYDILAAHPDGLAEHELLAVLGAENLPCFAEKDRHDPLEIFHRHFLLFHLLYGLRDRMRSQRRGDMEIHCLKIVLLLPNSGPGAGVLPEVYDPLRDYYLDLEQLQGVTRREVEKMLDRFWQLFTGNELRDSALEVFGLSESADHRTVKARYRQMVMECHPDRGGDPERFRQVLAAAEVLLPR